MTGSRAAIPPTRTSFSGGPLAGRLDLLALAVVLLGRGRRVGRLDKILIPGVLLDGADIEALAVVGIGIDVVRLPVAIPLYELAGRERLQVAGLLGGLGR